MKNTIKNIVVGSLVYTTAAVTGMSAVILADNFDANTPTLGTFRVYENNIGNGWYRPQQGPSTWDTSGGVLQNNGTGKGGVDSYPAYLTGEGATYNFFSGTSSVETSLALTFDYSVAAGDTLYVHLWAAQGTTTPGAFIGNNETAGGSLGLTEGAAGSTLDVFNLKDGATTGFGGASTAVGELTGSGTFNASYFLANTGIPGVSNTSEIDYFVLGFSKLEDTLAGTTTIDNVSFTSFSAPEPSSLALLGMGAALMAATRKRKMLRK